MTTENKSEKKSPFTKYFAIVMAIIIFIALPIYLTMRDTSDRVINQIKETMKFEDVSPAPVMSDWEYTIVKIKGGTGVLINDTQAYWIKGNKIYAANEAARILSPGIPFTQEVDYEAIKNFK